MKDNFPPVSVIIPTLNEAGFIRPCIESLIHGNFPLNKVEILVVDGGSSDGTQAIVRLMAEDYPFVKLAVNSKKIVPCALNIGLAMAKHDIIVWVGAHALYSENYLTRSVQVLLEKNCASVGGVLRAIGTKPLSKAIAAATNSKFGIGNAKYRHATEQQSVDTVFGGCWKRRTIDGIGGFDEKWIRNQDFELNCRLREMGGEIILDPSIRCEYFCRENLTGLASQYFQYGFWRFKTVVRHRASFSARLAAPLMLIIGLTMSAFIAPICIICAAVVPTIYLTSILAVGLLISIVQREIVYLVHLPIVFATLHISWGSGFLVSAMQHVYKELRQV